MQVTLRKFLEIAKEAIIPNECLVYIEQDDPLCGTIKNCVLGDSKYNAWGIAGFDNIDKLEPYLDYEVVGFNQEFQYGELFGQYITLREIKKEKTIGCFLGVSMTGACCILFTRDSFEELQAKKDILNNTSFIHDTTSWCGCDSIDRTCEIRKLHPTGRVLQLDKAITYHGTDYDCGHHYDWSFSFNKIMEVE